VDSLFLIKQALDLSQGRYNQHTNSQWQKKHNPQTHTNHPKHPIGDDLDTQLVIPIGGEERKLDGNEDDSSEGEHNSFLDTDACKTLDDYLNFITNKLPEFDHLHAFVSAKLLGEVDKIKDPHGLNQAYQHLRVSLNKAIPLLKVSKTSLENEISQLNITISSQKDAVDIHKFK
jgi:hypothetical protein